MSDAALQSSRQRTIAHALLEWAVEHRALANELAVPPIETQTGERVFPVLRPDDPFAEDVRKAEATLERIKIVSVAVDEARGRVVVLTKNQISAAAAKTLPGSAGGVPLIYIGGANVEPNPPAITYASSGAAARTFLHNGRIACGTSVTAAPVSGAGTLGALVRLPNGDLCGLTNNHVTAGCNHTRVGMHILSPAPIDADPGHIPPTAIGRHRSFITLASGDPRQVRSQEVDGALFDITDDDIVSSMQGDGLYDTPTSTFPPMGGLRVMKVGRTTGLTRGEIEGQFVAPLGVQYVSDHFKSMVYFDPAWIVRTITGDPFSLPGDSGSLVVTEDGLHAVGLVFAGSQNGDTSYIIPIESVLMGLGAQLVSGHGI